MILSKDRKKITNALSKDRPRLNFRGSVNFPMDTPREQESEASPDKTKTLAAKTIANLTKKMAYYLSSQDKKSIRDQKRFLLSITIIPLTLAILIVSILTYMSLSFYSNQMMGNSANIILQELEEIQNNMLSNAKHFISERYESKLDELILVRNFLLESRKKGNNLTKAIEEKIDKEKISCWGSNDLDYINIPFCVDSTNMADYSKSTDSYRKIIAKSNSVFNAERVVKRDFSVFKKWAKISKKEVSLLLTSFNLLRSLQDHNELEYDKKDEITYIGHSKEGIFARNFFNFQGPATYNKISRSDCKFGLHSDMHTDTIYYDPRCRPWFSVVIEFLSKYSKEFKIEKKTGDQFQYPIITSDPYKQIDDSKKVTVCTFDQFDSTKSLTEMDIFVICKDIFADTFIESLSQAYATMIVQYLDFLKFNPDVKSLLDDYNKTIQEVKKGTSQTQRPFTNWCKRLKKFSNDMGWFVLYLDKNIEYKVLMDVDGFYLSSETKYKKFEKILKSITFKSSVEAKLSISEKIGSGKDTISITISSIGYQRTQDSKWIEWVKVAFLLPQGNMAEWALKQSEEARENLIEYSLLTFFLIILILFLSCWLMWKFASSISKQLSKIIYAAEMIRQKVPFSKDSIKLWDTYEISNLYVSFLQLDSLINAAFEYSSTHQDTEAAIKLTVSTKIFKTLGNFNLLGILYNNLGNIFFALKDYDKAIDSYEKAVDNAVGLYEGKLESHGAEQTLFFEKKNSRLMNLILTKKQKIEKFGFKSYSKLDDIKSTANSIYLDDKSRDIFHGRQIICLCIMNWSCRIRKDLEGCDMCLNSISQVLKSTKARDLYRKYPDFLLQQEVRYEKAMTDFAKGKKRKAIYILIAGLKRNKFFDLGQRKKFLKVLIDKVGKTRSLRITDGMMKLHKRYLSRAPKKYILLGLDYSRSMRVAGKLENSVKSLLNIWDRYIKPEDKVAFVRFNLNIEKVFEFQSKYVNEFSKRHQIEQSTFPRDRTSLYDTISDVFDMFDLVPKFNSKKFVVMITDGDDRSSIQELEALKEKLRSSEITLIIGGIGVKENVKKDIKELVKNTPAGVFVDTLKGNLEHCVQVMTSFSSFGNFNFLNFENDM